MVLTETAVAFETMTVTETQHHTYTQATKVTVPAPAAALVFISSGAQAAADAPSATQTFATTSVTKLIATASINPTSLALSNGERPDVLLGTSAGGVTAGDGEVTPPSFWRSLMWLYLRAGLLCQNC